MFKSKLQELCQRRRWSLPEYSILKEGLDHDPRFMAIVVVNDLNFETPVACKSSKDAQNTAARVAFDYLTDPTPTRSKQQHADPPFVQPPVVVVPIPLPFVPGMHISQVPEHHVVPMPVSPIPASLPLPPAGLLAPKFSGTMKLSRGEITHKKCEVQVASNICRNPVDSRGILHLYKNLLQQYAQKKNLELPVYTCESEGPPHARKFKSKVHFDGKPFETFEYFPTLKEAEHAAAKVACQMLSVDENEEDGGLYKNLLQEFAQKRGFDCPVYETFKSGLSHTPLFRSTVQVENNIFRGDEAYNKKHAEMNAAKVAYCVLAGNSSATEPLKIPEIGGILANKLSINIQPTEIVGRDGHATGYCNRSPPVTAKKIKSSPEEKTNYLIAASPSNLYNLSPVPAQAHSAVTDPVLLQPVEPQRKLCARTVVLPYHPNLSIPEGASIMPFSDDNWVAYKVGLY